MVAGRLVLEEQREAEAERNEAAGRERSVRHGVQVDHEQRHSEDDERDAAPVRVEDGEAVQR